MPNILESISEWAGWIWPTSDTSISGYNFTETHHGIDIGANLGDPIWSPTGGVVTEVSYDKDGYGNYVKIKAHTGETIILAHLSEVFVSKGVAVGAGTVVGEAGSTGNSTGPHLHFEVRTAGGGGYVNPWDIFGTDPEPGEPGDWGTAPPWSGETGDPGTPGDGDGEYLPIVTPIGKVKIPLPKVNWVNVVIILAGIGIIAISVTGFVTSEVLSKALSPISDALRASD